MLIGRRVEFVEVFDINMDIYETVRDDEDFCRRVLMAADPVLSQKIKCGPETAKKGIKMISRILDVVGESIYPVPKEYLNNRFDLPATCVEGEE